MSTTSATVSAWVSTGTGRRVKVDVPVEVANGQLVSQGGGGGGAFAVKNETGTALAALALVYVSGWDDTDELPLVALADSNAANKQAMFILPAAIPEQGTGLAYTAYLSAATLNTNSVSSAGDPVYLSETAGGWTVTAPTAAGSNAQIVGHVVVKSATVGQIRFHLDDASTIATDDIQDLAVTTGKLAAVAVTEAKIEVGAASAGLSGLVVKFSANANVIGAIPVLHRVDLAAGALAETNVTLTHKTRVIDAWVVLTGAGVASTTVKVQNGATTITDAMDVSGSDKAIIRAATLDDAQWDIAAAGTLRIKSETGATQPACTVFVLGLRVA